MDEHRRLQHPEGVYTSSGSCDCRGGAEEAAEEATEEVTEEAKVDEPETYTGSIYCSSNHKGRCWCLHWSKGDNLRKYVIAKTYKDMEDDDGKNDGKVTCTVKASEEGDGYSRMSLYSYSTR